MSKRIIADMTRGEFADAMEKDPIILLCLGSIEQHGPACPMGDFVLAESLARRVSEDTGALLAPTLPFGHADYFRSVPGAIALRAPTFRAVLRDMVECYLEHGLKRLVILNGHGGNKAPLLETLRDIRRDWDVVLPSVSMWGNIPLSTWQEAYPNSGKATFGHGSEPVASLYLKNNPDAMRMDLACEFESRKAFRGFPNASMGKITSGEIDIQLPLNVDNIHDQGFTGGSLAGATAQRGEIFEAGLAKQICAFIRRYYPT